MSEPFYDELEQLIGKHRQAEKEAATEEANEARFKRLEDAVGGIGSLIDERLPAKNSPAADTSESSAENRGEEKSIASDNPPPESQDENLEVERVSNFNVPKVYVGDDEPEIVKYIDADTGEEKTRKGRRKNRPTIMNVQRVEAVETEEPEGIPTEPDEASA